jgi:DNA-binding transcriptional regulator/RsmH inhibitor MraZ
MIETDRKLAKIDSKGRLYIPKRLGKYSAISSKISSDSVFDKLGIMRTH